MQINYNEYIILSINQGSRLPFNLNAYNTCFIFREIIQSVNAIICQIMAIFLF